MQAPLSQPSYEVHVHDLPYRHADGRVLRALIYEPRGEQTATWEGYSVEQFPALVCVHGGAWISGDRTMTRSYAERIAACGIVVMAIDFRMAPQDPYPSSLQDINYATRWLKLHAADFGVDPSGVGGFGASSGAHLALLSAMRPYDERYAALPLEESASSALNAEFAFVISCSGVLDPLARYHMAKARYAEAGYAEIMACHRAYFGDEEVMAEASPPLIAERHEPAHLPPLLMFQGDADPRLPPDMANRTAAAYKAAGGIASAVYYPKMGHALSEWGSHELNDVIQRISAFIATHTAR